MNPEATEYIHDFKRLQMVDKKKQVWNSISAVQKQPDHEKQN